MQQRSTEEILSDLPDMHQAQVVERLMDGPTNTSYRVECNGRWFVLRLDKPQTRMLGLDRDSEYAVCAAVAAAGLTVPHLYVDRAAGVCLRPFVPGRSMRSDELFDPQMLGRLAGLLRRLHRLPPVGSRFDAVSAARRYAEQVVTPRAAELAEEAARLAAMIRQHPSPLAICHNDLVAENMLLTPDREIVLIDWEYAAKGDPFFDLAVVVRHHELSDDLAYGFLNAYLEGPPSGSEKKRFMLQCAFYDCLLDLWNLRIADP